MEFELPPPSALAWMVREYAQLRAEHGEVIGDPELVLPTGAFFPDPVTASAEGVNTLLRRTMTYAPLAEDLLVTFDFVMPGDDAAGGASCSTGGCGGGAGASPLASVRASDGADGYLVSLSTADAGDPARLMTSLARVTGGLVLHEGGDEGADDPGRLELAAIAIGLGVLVVSGSYVYAKGCGGARVHQGTALSVVESSALLALFCRVHRVKPSLARAHLALTQREAFDRALVFWESNERVIETLRTAPELLVGGAFALDSARGPVARLLGWLGRDRSAAREDENKPSARPARVRTEAEERRFALAKAMAADAAHALVGSESGSTSGSS
jgi:hypothetical protein